MSGFLVDCVGRLRARASNYQSSNLLQGCYKSAAHLSAMRFPVFATSDGMIHLVAFFLLCGCNGCKGDLVAVLVSRTCPSLLIVSFRSSSACLISRMRNATRVWGSVTFEHSNFPFKRMTFVGCTDRMICILRRPRMSATWLILPVVICLSQRLSHACASMNQFEL